MAKIPQISDAEWAVMDVLWARNPLTGNEVYQELVDNQEWQLKTVKTLLNRLVAKKAIAFKTEGRIYHYYPLVSKNDCIKKENNSFLQRLYQGSVKKMITAFAENDSLSADDIRELKEILKKYEENK